MNFTYYSGLCSILDPWSNIDFLHSLVVSSLGYLFSFFHTFYQNLTKKHSNLSKGCLVTHLIPPSFYGANKLNSQHSNNTRLHSTHKKLQLWTLIYLIPKISTFIISFYFKESSVWVCICFCSCLQTYWVHSQPSVNILTEKGKPLLYNIEFSDKYPNL